jgi:RNA polymerase sigma-70 factor (ECF subfamily)
MSRGDGLEAARLFELYSERIFRFCLRRLGSRADAEDAVQTTFLCALRALRRGVVPESEAAWLFTIAKNVCVSEQRTVFRRDSRSCDVDIEILAAAQPSEDEGELLLGLREALASIPQKQRRALILRECEGFSGSEIAARLGMSTPATYALLTRARRSLTQAMTAGPRRPVLCLDFGILLFQLKAHLRPLLGVSSAKVMATTVAVAGIAVGGVSVERALDGDAAPRTPASVSERADTSRAARGSVVRSDEGGPLRDRRAIKPMRDPARSERSRTGTRTEESAGVTAQPPMPATTTSPQTDLVPPAEIVRGDIPEAIPDPQLPDVWADLPVPLDLEPSLDLPLELPLVPDADPPLDLPLEPPLVPDADPPLDLPLEPPLVPDADPPLDLPTPEAQLPARP